LVTLRVKEQRANCSWLLFFGERKRARVKERMPNLCLELIDFTFKYFLTH